MTEQRVELGRMLAMRRADKILPAMLQQLLQRRHCNVVVVALAKKIARTVWAVLVKGAAFDPIKWNPTELVHA